MTSLHTYTYTHVRTQFLSMEILGFVNRTIRLPVVRKVVEHGMNNGSLAWLEVFLHDNWKKKARLKLSIDWKSHRILMSRGLHGADFNPNRGEDEVSSERLAGIARVFNGIKKEKGYKYWYNCGWTAESDLNDQKCGISRNGKSYLSITSPKTFKFLRAHEDLEELFLEVEIETGD